MMDKDSFDYAYGLLTAGRDLTPDEVRALEKEVGENDALLESRLKLLGYYSHHQFRSSSSRTARIKHIAWMITNCPGDSLTGMPECRISRGCDRWRDFDRLSRLWQEQAKLHWGNAKVLGNAGDFFILNQIDLAEKYFLRAKELEPDNDRWASRLSQIYEFLGPTYESMALAECERCLSLCKEVFGRLSALIRLPELAYEAKDYDRSAKYAADLMQQVEANKNEKAGFLSPLAVEAAHIALGRIALRQGDIKTASEHLIQSLPDNPGVVMPSTPDRHLAAELFEAGERDAILQWLDRCKFVINVADWKESVERGESPWLYELPAYHRYFCLSRLPRPVFNRGDFEKARWAANEFIMLAHREETNIRHRRRHAGFGLHISHVVLGQLALREGDIAGAKKSLALAAQVREAESLQEDGPDMSLAAELAKAGEIEAARQFLKDCKRLWGTSSDRYLLKEWDAELKNGRLPEDWQLLLQDTETEK